MSVDSLTAGMAGMALLAGAALGAFFFGGLWWTVRRAAASKRPAGWFLGSALLRTGVVLAGFYLVGAGQPWRLGLSLLGFVLARALVRVLVLRSARPPPAVVASPGLPSQGLPPCA